MYRCYLLREGRIVKAENLDAATLDSAIVAGRELLSAQAPSRGFNGLEIWHAASLLYSDSGQCAGGVRDHGRSSRDEATFVHDASVHDASVHGVSVHDALGQPADILAR